MCQGRVEADGNSQAINTENNLFNWLDPIPESFEYVYQNIKRDVHLQSMSGGTDLCGCLVAGDPTGPVNKGKYRRLL